ncbi:tyrosinase family protein [Halomonas ramblicola]|uniref:tyrosinase family protein n=1 Tax=Halomonas ramblicola TaxID=747349 RepID=UPI0025B31B83|nr:tyrosinase family protein [Halomonas ramblicola]MDN3523574.1 tyrosinase family protein [Halomonas ramblicola]
MSSMTDHPTWDDEIAALFAAPYWLPKAERTPIATQWQGCMSGYGIQLNDPASVAAWSVTIFNHLASRSMPLTADSRQYWPEPALRLLAAWINDGCRRSSSDPIDYQERIPPWEPLPVSLRVRRDIVTLSRDELDRYRMALDDILQVANPAAEAPWQRLAYLHTNWCLHYQEAFAFWHRAYLMWFERQIGMPVPYWNFMAAGTSVDGEPAAGIPQAFKDETYIRPDSGEERPNPLRYAAARDGRSKACQGDRTGGAEGGDCTWVHRDPLLYTVGDDRRQARIKKLKLVRLYQQQIMDALKFDAFSHPQGWPGYPWANIPSFDPPPPNSDYPYRNCNFDGLYEQPHDNFHGWLGPDMADNAYTAFDPIFWSYHANIDRMLEVWLRAHPSAIYTAGYPLRPFIGSTVTEISLTDPHPWRYTTIGDLATDSRRLGYDYGPPCYPDSRGETAHAVAAAQGGADAKALYILFEGVSCTQDSYQIDVFIDQSDSGPDAADPDNPHYVGRLTRIGMGIRDDKGRCVRQGVTRVLNATRAAQRLGLTAGTEVSISLVVTDPTTGALVPAEHYEALPGFTPEARWGAPWPSPQALRSTGSGCPACH